MLCMDKSVMINAATFCKKRKEKKIVSFDFMLTLNQLNGI